MCFMKQTVLWILIINLTIVSIFSCKKQNSTEPCSDGAPIARQLINKPATIVSSNGRFLIIEDSTIDERLLPCDLPEEFKIDQLRVIVSGKVKSTLIENSNPCCTAYFEIATITR